MVTAFLIILGVVIVGTGIALFFVIKGDYDILTITLIWATVIIVALVVTIFVYEWSFLHEPCVVVMKDGRVYENVTGEITGYVDETLDSHKIIEGKWEDKIIRFKSSEIKAVILQKDSQAYLDYLKAPSVSINPLF